MTYQQTSLLAYFDAKENIGDNQNKVLTAIKVLGVCTDKQIASYLGWEINRVVPRRNELASPELGLIVEAGTTKNECNRTVITWQAK